MEKFKECNSHLIGPCQKLIWGKKLDVAVKFSPSISQFGAATRSKPPSKHLLKFI